MINPPDKSESQNQANENPVDSMFTRDALKRENLMIQNLSLAVDMTTLLAGNAFAEVHEVQMLNRAADARRAFEPAFLQIAVATPSNS